MAFKSIGMRIYFSVGVMALVAVLVGWFAIDTMRTYNRFVDAMNLASLRARTAEQINGEINSVVMDSRGIYMSQSLAEATRYGDGLLKALAKLESLRAALVKTYPAAEAGAIAKLSENVQAFDKFRRELVRLSRLTEEGALKNARSFGDNDANRTVRQALNAAVVAYAEVVFKEVAAGQTLLDDFYRERLILLSAIIVIGILGGGIVAGWHTTFGIERPLTALCDVMRQLTAGNYAVEIPHAGRADELGLLADSLAQFRAGGLENLRLQSDAQDRQRAETARIAEQQARDRAAEEEARRREDERREADAQRERDAQEAARRARAEKRAEEERARIAAEEERRAQMRRLASDFETEVGAVVGAVATAATGMQTTATTMHQITDGTARQAQEASGAAELAAGNVQTVAAATEELTASIGEISSQVASSSEVARQAVAEAERTNAIVKGLSTAVDKIGEVLALITSIAGQTNLLALNATIEAARAGEMGKGFAVVASEVKNLATQTAKATDEIAQQIDAVQGATGEAVMAIGNITGIIRRIDEISGAIAAAVEEQGAATREIARNVDQAANGTRQTSGNVQAVSRAAAEAGQAATQVLESARDLSGQADRLRTQVSAFVSRVRAG